MDREKVEFKLNRARSNFAERSKFKLLTVAQTSVDDRTDENRFVPEKKTVFLQTPLLYGHSSSDFFYLY